MSRKVFTLRIDPPERAALKNLSKVLHRPMNQLLNEAIKIYLSQQGQQESELEASLEKLKAYRRKDPSFKKAIARIVDAEISNPDPAEGKPVEGEIIDGKLVEKTRPVQSELRNLLDA